MHVRSWAHCLAHDPDTDTWCRRRPSTGVFCASHALEFQCDEAAKAATRLARARFLLKDPSATRVQRWGAALSARRARSLRRSLSAKIAKAEGTRSGHGMPLGDYVPIDDIITWR
jgi:hypothetical protein